MGKDEWLIRHVATADEASFATMVSCEKEAEFLLMDDEALNCPFCDKFDEERENHIYFFKGKKRFTVRCAYCMGEYSLLRGSLAFRSKIGLTMWIHAIRLIYHNGITSSRDLADLLGTTSESVNKLKLKLLARGNPLILEKN